MGTRLLGAETEFAVMVKSGNNEPLDRTLLVHQIIQLAHSSLPNLPDGSSSGVFLRNAARLYLDCGEHPEISTPECTNRLDAVTYLEAGHRLMLELARRAARDLNPGATADVFRICVDYDTRNTWGSHESHMHLMPPVDLQRHVIPHLATRIIITGAGGFDPFAPGLKFTLSPRSAHAPRA